MTKQTFPRTAGAVREKDWYSLGPFAFGYAFIALRKAGLLYG